MAPRWRRPNRGIVNSWLAFVLDPARFGDLDGFREELAAVIADVKASPPADPDCPVLVAGEKERLTKARRLAEGIPVDATTWGNLVAAARSLGALVRRLVNSFSCAVSRATRRSRKSPPPRIMWHSRTSGQEVASASKASSTACFWDSRPTRAKKVISHPSATGSMSAW